MTSSPNRITDTILDVHPVDSDGTAFNVKVSDADVSTSNPLPASLATLISGEDQTDNIIRVANKLEYETVAASQTDQVIGATGAAGDTLTRIIINCAATTNNAITVKDGGTTIFTSTAGMAIGVTSLEIGLVSVSGAWKITTGSSVQVTAIGLFT